MTSNLLYEILASHNRGSNVFSTQRKNFSLRVKKTIDTFLNALAKSVSITYRTLLEGKRRIQRVRTYVASGEDYQRKAVKWLKQYFIELGSHKEQTS